MKKAKGGEMTEGTIEATKLKSLLNKYSHPEKVVWLRTGLHALDLALGSGIPLGRVIEIFGTESGGKTLLALLIGRAFQMAGGAVIMADVESTANATYMTTIGVNVDEIIYEKPGTVEEVRDIMVRNVVAIREVAPLAPILFIWDSIAATSALGEWEKDKSTGQMMPREHNMGRRAAAMSDFFKQFGPWMTKQNVTLVAVNQIRDKIGVLYGRKTDSPGGHALKFHASIRIELNRGKKFEVGDQITGIECHLRTDKSKVATPFRKATLRIEWGKGFELFAGLDEILLESGRVKQGKVGHLKVGDEEFKKADLPNMVAKYPNLLESWL